MSTAGDIARLALAAGIFKACPGTLDAVLKAAELEANKKKGRNLSGDQREDSVSLPPCTYYQGRRPHVITSDVAFPDCGVPPAQIVTKECNPKICPHQSETSIKSDDKEKAQDECMVRENTRRVAEEKRRQEEEDKRAAEHTESEKRLQEEMAKRVAERTVLATLMKDDQETIECRTLEDSFEINGVVYGVDDVKRILYAYSKCEVPGFLGLITPSTFSLEELANRREPWLLFPKAECCIGCGIKMHMWNGSIMSQVFCEKGETLTEKYSHSVARILTCIPKMLLWYAQRSGLNPLQVDCDALRQEGSMEYCALCPRCVKDFLETATFREKCALAKSEEDAQKSVIYKRMGCGVQVRGSIVGLGGVSAYVKLRNEFRGAIPLAQIRGIKPYIARKCRIYADAMGCASAPVGQILKGTNIVAEIGGEPTEWRCERGLGGSWHCPVFPLKNGKLDEGYVKNRATKKVRPITSDTALKPSRKAAEPAKTKEMAESVTPKPVLLIDGTNIALNFPEYKSNALRLLLAELEQRGYSVCVVFDANIRYKLKERNDTDGLAWLAELEKRGTDVCCIVAAGTRADDNILQYADVHGCHVISCDRYNDFRERFPWLNKKIEEGARLHPVSMIRKELIIPGLGLTIKMEA